MKNPTLKFIKEFSCFEIENLLTINELKRTINAHKFMAQKGSN